MNECILQLCFVSYVHPFSFSLSVSVLSLSLSLLLLRVWDSETLRDTHAQVADVQPAHLLAEGQAVFPPGCVPLPRPTRGRLQDARFYSNLVPGLPSPHFPNHPPLGYKRTGSFAGPKPWPREKLGLLLAPGQVASLCNPPRRKEAIQTQIQLVAACKSLLNGKAWKGVTVLQRLPAPPCICWPEAWAGPGAERAEVRTNSPKRLRGLGKLSQSGWAAVSG